MNKNDEHDKTEQPKISPQARARLKFLMKEKILLKLRMLGYEPKKKPTMH